jgi:hypothetical protein
MYAFQLLQIWVIAAFYHGVNKISLQGCYIAWPLKIGAVVYPEISVTNYQSTLYNIPEEHRYSNILLI